MKNINNFNIPKIIENTPRVETENLVLRKFSHEDVNDVFEIFSDKEINRFLPWYPFQTLEEAKTHIDKYISFYKENVGYRYAVCLKESNKVVGYVHVANDESLDVGYAIKKEFWNKGIITEACKALLEKLKNAGFKYATATHDVNNSASGCVMKKIGMKYKYSYVEMWEPKKIETIFRMYQINFNPNNESVFMKYWDKYENHFIENDV